MAIEKKITVSNGLLQIKAYLVVLKTMSQCQEGWFIGFERVNSKSPTSLVMGNGLNSNLESK